MRPPAFLASLAFVLSVPLSLATANTIHVPGDQPTIQAAINVALAGDTVLVAPGTYAEHLVFNGTQIVVKSSAGPAVTTVQGSNYQSVVSFTQGDGPGTVLEGFTITGGYYLWGGGVFCNNSSPTLRRNIIRNNYAQAGHGNGTGGGIFAVDSNVVIEENQILDNLGDFTGGGICLVRCQATLIRNVIADNRGGAGLGSWGGGVACLYGSSTFLGNTIVNNAADTGGGIVCNGSTIVVRDSVVWGNTVSYGAVQILVSGTGGPTVEYCDVQGGWTGTGNIDENPQFQNGPGGDYSFVLGSLCIDAGDPASTFDPDGTRADVGALSFGQYTAATAIRNGSGINALLYSPTTTPVIGTNWTASVDTSGHAGATSSLLVGFAAQGTSFVIGAGEVLIDPWSPLYFFDFVVPAGGVANHSLGVPLDYRLSGVTASTQALVLGGGPELCNAVDLRIGL